MSSSSRPGAGPRSRGGLLWSVVTAVRTSLRPGTPGLGERGAALPRYLRAVLSGDYRGSTRGHVGLLLLAALYVVSPVDLVPEALLGLLGLADDALVVTWLAATLVHDTEGFLAWERERQAAPGAGSHSHAAADRSQGPGHRDAYGRPQDAPSAQTVPGHVVG